MSTTTQQSGLTKAPTNNTKKNWLSATASYSPDQATTLAWLIDHMQATGASVTSIAPQIGYSSTVLSRVFNGQYATDIAPIIANIDSYRHTITARANQADDLPFISTATSRQIFDLANYARIKRQIVTLIGESQRGKTFAATQYAAANPSNTFFLRCPTAPTHSKIIHHIARLLKLPTYNKNADLILHDIIQRLTPQHLLIIDEVHQIVYQPLSTGIRTIEVLRYIADQSNCGLMLIGTSPWLEAINSSSLWGTVLAQTTKRGIVCNLTNNLPDADIVSLFDHYNLPKPSHLDFKPIRTIAHIEGIGNFTKFLAAGFTLAKKRTESYSWHHFFAAQSTISQLRNPQ